MRQHARCTFTQREDMASTFWNSLCACKCKCKCKKKVQQRARSWPLQTTSNNNKEREQGGEELCAPLVHLMRRNQQQSKKCKKKNNIRRYGETELCPRIMRSGGEGEEPKCPIRPLTRKARYWPKNKQRAKRSEECERAKTTCTVTPNGKNHLRNGSITGFVRPRVTHLTEC